MTGTPSISVLLEPGWEQRSLVDDARRGLGSQPRALPAKWLYDDVGSALFDQITTLPEYYPTEAERSILRAHAAEIATLAGASTLVELGSGTSDKTRLLLDALQAHGALERFVPIDVSEATLREAAERLAVDYPGLAVHAIVGDFTLHLGHLPTDGRRLVAFLGGTIGNFDVAERAAFLAALGDQLGPGEALLLGTDLVKSADRLIAAYDDSGGVTARFITNALTVLNRELGADFDVAAFSYVPFWDPCEERMDLRLRADTAQHVRLPGAGLEIDLEPGEEIRVEISSKFRTDRLAGELADAGFTVTRQWTDAPGEYALTLAHPR